MSQSELLPSDGFEAPTREEVLDLLEDGIREAHRKVQSGRVRDVENEQVRIKWVRALAYAAGQYRQLRKDMDLADLEQEIADLRRQVEGDDPDRDPDADADRDADPDADRDAGLETDPDLGVDP